MLLEITRYALEAWNDYDLRLDDCAPVVDRYEWSETQHPRFDAGAAGGVGGEFRPKGGSGGGAAASTQVNAPANRVASQVVDAWRKSGSGQQKPTASKPAKRELAALPTIDKDHALHHSKLPPAMQQKVLDWNYRMYQLVSPVGIYGGQAAPGMRDQAEEAGWETVDKNAVRAMLTEMNQMDVEARSAGVPLADFVNANGIIPRALAERLDGGARFFDPEKLRGKLGNGPIQRPAPREETPPPEPQKPLTAAEQKTATDFSQATRQRRGEMLANPSIKEAIERAMGLKPSTGGFAQPDGGYGPKPLPQDQSTAPEPAKPSKPERPPKPVDHIKVLADANRGLRALGYKSSDAGSLLRKAIAGGKKFESAAELMEAAMGDTTQPKSKWAMKDGLTGVASGKVDEVVSELAGTNLDKQEHFKGAVLDSWKNLKAEADDHNDALRQITAHFGKSLGTLASNLSQGVDTAKIKGFDQLIDHAVREYPQLVSRLMGESSAGGPEDALADALREGIREVPQPWDDAVIDRAMSMVGPGFFEDTPPMEDVPAGSEEPLDWEGVPFSVRSDVRRWVQRYWIKSDSIESDILDRWAEVDRHSQISAWVDKYATQDSSKVSLGCIMLEAPKAIKWRVIRLQDGIARDDLTGDGLENWPHVTVFYGIVDTSIADVVAMVRGFSPVELSFGKLSTFNNDDESVLKLEVESSELRALNQKIKDAFPSRQTRKDYKPHLTIAYLKPEAAKDHIGKCSLTGGTALFTHAVVSIGGEKQRVNLKDGSVENFATKDKYSRRSFVPVLLERKTAIAS